MAQVFKSFAGGCLCGSLRYEVTGRPVFAGFCCCVDCRKVSGSGFVPFIGIDAKDVRFSGAARQSRSKAHHGGEAVRNFCPGCGGLVFGGIAGQDDLHTIYAGSLDDPTHFAPTIAIFIRDRPDWVALPTGLTHYDTVPD